MGRRKRKLRNQTKMKLWNGGKNNHHEICTRFLPIWWKKINNENKATSRKHPLTFVVGFDFLLELFHLLIAFLLFLLAPEGQRSKIGFVLGLLLLIFTHQRVLVVIGDPCRRRDKLASTSCKYFLFLFFLVSFIFPRLDVGQRARRTDFRADDHHQIGDGLTVVDQHRLDCAVQHAHF